MEAKTKDRVDADSELIRFTLSCLRAAVEATCTVWLEFPEDLGSCTAGDPASLWQLPECQELQKMGLQRGALFQCEWSPTDYGKPTGIYTNSDGILKDKRFYKGWPSFTTAQGSNWRAYSGPLPCREGRPGCSHGAHPPLRRRQADGSWKTSATAAYAPEFCRQMARGLLTTEMGVDLPNGPKSAPTQSEGQGAALERRAPEGKPQATPAAFRAPQRPAAPTRTTITGAADLVEGVVYIGRGSNRLGLPASKWGNPCKISERLSRKEAIVQHLAWLKSQTELLLALRQL